MAGKIFLVPENIIRPSTPFFINKSKRQALCTEDIAIKYGAVPDFQPLTPGEKERYFTDPVFYFGTEVITKHGGKSHLVGNGTRHLTYEQSGGAAETYGYYKNEFTDMLSLVRTAQGKDQHDSLQGLDIGGSTGLAARDAEQLDPNLSMTNITISPEIGIWPLRGGHKFLFAERLPVEYSEQFDIIFSHLAFRYMRYRDIALENAIRALRKGGILRIDFTSDTMFKPGESREQIDRDMDVYFRRMEDLQRQEIIRYLPVNKNRFKDVREDWKQGNSCVHGLVYLQKTGSLALA